MRKASKILFLIGGIVSIAVAVTYLIFGIVMIAIPSNEEFLKSFFEEYSKTSTSTLPEDEALAVLKGTLIGLGVFFLIWTALGVVNSVLAFKAFNDSKNGRPAKGLSIANIVLGVISGVEVNIVGAIFALVADGQEDRRKELESK